MLTGRGILPALVLTASGLFASAASAAVDFNRDVRPIMSDTCFVCHGFDAKSRKADLRLDVREQALKKLESGATPIVPGKPDESEIIKRIFSDDKSELMPPPKSHKVLTDTQKQTIKQWVAEGAKYQAHWAFAAPVRPTPPEVTSVKSKPVNGIDRFVLAKLQQEKLDFSPEADRRTLIRRVTLDLTGIPPTPAEVEAFVADTSPNAYEKVVDRLLASPRYGERMAAQWLDYARYADSHGYQTDSSRSMWPWREWVINAFNQNKPFDQFTIEQIAGDMLPNATVDQIVATGFNRNHRINGEGGIIAEEWQIETVIDRVETTGQTWLALTLNCCRCHDHKYDPITQKEFYQLFAFFNGSADTGHMLGASNRAGGNLEPTIRVATSSQTEELAKLQAKVEAAKKHVAEVEKKLPELVAAWEPTFTVKPGTSVAVWSVLSPTQVKSKGGASMSRLPDGSYLAGGKNPQKDVYTVTAPLTAGQLSGLLLEALPDASLPLQSLGRNSNGNFVLSRVEAEIISDGKTIPVTFTTAKADFSQQGWDVANLIGKTPIKANAKSGGGWAIAGNDPANRVVRKAMLLTDKPIAVPANAVLNIQLKQETLNNHNVGRFRLSVTSLPPAVVTLEGPANSNGISAAVQTALATPAANRTPKMTADIQAYFRANVDSPVRKADEELAAANRAVANFDDKLPVTMVMKEMPKPRDSFILNRGEYDKKGAKVEPGLPAALSPLPAGAPMNRLGLAKWLVDPANPLTARVWVNRQWEKFFGVGIVKTVENFGSQAEPPMNPELLDFLATEFVRLGWDMKALQKEMLMSAAYRQSSHVTPELIAKDPENRLLARGPRFRLTGEMVRDQALAVSGLLVEKIGGPSVRPYMPENVWDETSRYGDLRGYKADAGDGLYRRTIYTVWKRTAAPPTMMLFDAPTRETCVVKRSRTNTPLQALALLNEVTYVEAARSLAQHMMTEGGSTPADRISWAFRRATARTPDEAELRVLTVGYEKRLAKFQADKESAAKLISQGASKPDAKLDPAELAAYTLTANVIMNLDEVVTRE